MEYTCRDSFFPHCTNGCTIFLTITRLVGSLGSLVLSFGWIMCEEKKFTRKHFCGRLVPVSFMDSVDQGALAIPSWTFWISTVKWFLYNDMLESQDHGVCESPT